jgi:hypothetical protein
MLILLMPTTGSGRQTTRKNLRLIWNVKKNDNLYFQITAQLVHPAS